MYSVVPALVLLPVLLLPVPEPAVLPVHLHVWPVAQAGTSEVQYFASIHPRIVNAGLSP